MDEATKCSRCRESFEMGAGFAAALPEAADLADAEGFADESVEVDAAGDDVAPSLFRRDGYSASLEFVERLGFDQGDVLSDTARAGREGSGLVLVAVAVDSARTRSDRGACERVRGGMRRGHQCHDLPDLRLSTIGDGEVRSPSASVEGDGEQAVHDLEFLTAAERVVERTRGVAEHEDGPPAAR